MFPALFHTPAASQGRWHQTERPSLAHSSIKLQFPSNKTFPGLSICKLITSPLLGKLPACSNSLIELIGQEGTHVAKILVVDDDESLTKLVLDWLATENHLVDTSSDGHDALNKLKLYNYDLVILDW